jgi:hypothetical protein
LATNPKDKVFALMGLFNDFAHRDACHLGLCERSHPLPQIEAIPALPNAMIDRNTKGDFGQVRGALLRAMIELIKHERVVQQVKHERYAARILCSLDHAQHIRHCLIEYLRINLYNLEDIAARYEGVDFGATSTEDDGDNKEDNIQQNADGENNDMKDIERAAKHIEDFLNQDFEAPDLQVEQVFTSHVTTMVGEDWKRMEDLAAHRDTIELHWKAAKHARSRLRYYLDLLGFDKEVKDGDQKNEPCQTESFCGVEKCHNSHTLTSTEGQIGLFYFFGKYIIMFYSCDTNILSVAMEAIGRSQLLPPEDCTLKGASWRLLKAVFGNMTDWNRENIGKGILSKGEVVLDQNGESPAEEPDLQTFVDAKWLGMPIPQYIKVCLSGNKLVHPRISNISGAGTSGRNTQT